MGGVEADTERKRTDLDQPGENVKDGYPVGPDRRVRVASALPPAVTAAGGALPRGHSEGRHGDSCSAHQSLACARLSDFATLREQAAIHAKKALDHAVSHAHEKQCTP